MMWLSTLRRCRYALFPVLLLLAAACASGTATPPMGGPEVSVVMVTTDLAVGDGVRVAFGLVDRDGFPVRDQEAQVRAIYLPSGEDIGEVRDEATAGFVQWPTGQQGIFVARLDLDTVGFWGLEATVSGEDGAPVVARGAFEVKEDSDTPSIGERAPASVTPTLDDTEDLSTITSATEPDPGLYRLSVHQALETRKPLVVVFATPAFCVSATCGPQVEMVSHLKEEYGGRANFIHVEVIQDPHLLDGGRSEGDFVPTVEEWGLPTEPWTFVVDGQGDVRAKFEQFAAREEIEAALLEVL